MAGKLSYTPKTYECTCCGLTKPETDFYRQSYTGLRSNECKTCTNVKRQVLRSKYKHSKFVSSERRRHMDASLEYSIEDWRDAMLHFGGECCYCGAKEGRGKTTKFDREHLLPISNGGKTVRNNIAPACRACNRARGNKPLLEWYRSRPFWTQEREDRILAWINQNK